MSVSDEEIKNAYDELSEWEFGGFTRLQLNDEPIRKIWGPFLNFLNEAGIAKSEESYDELLERVARYGAAVAVAEIKGEEQGFVLLWLDGEPSSQIKLYCEALEVSISLEHLIKDHVHRDGLPKSEKKAFFAAMRSLIDDIESESFDEE